MRRRPLLRAAAIGGGAYLAGKAVARRQSEQEYQDEEQDARISALEQPAPAPAAAPPPAPAGQEAAGPSIAEQLNQLSELHRQGALTDEEFSAAKAGLLGTSA